MKTESSASSCIEMKYCTTAQEFLGFLSLANPIWGTGLSHPWLFRGHADEKWKLIPPSWRPQATEFYDPLVRRFTTLAARCLKERHSALENQDIYVELIAQSAAEIEAVNGFGQLADTIGLPGLGDHDLDISGKEYIERIANREKLDTGEFALSQVHALAQHHGVPTRLLDWTRRPETAAYFAVREHEKEQASDYVAVWALNWEDTVGRPRTPNLAYFRSYSEAKLQLLLTASKNSEYMHAQQGLLIYHSAGNQYYLEHGAWPAFEDAIEEMCKNTQVESPQLRKVLLPCSETNEVRRLLWRQGITEAHLMPSYDAVVRSLREKWDMERHV